MVKFRWETDFKETEIGKIPKDWEVKELGKLFKVKNGKRPPLVNNDDEYEIWGANGLMGYTSNYNETGELLVTGRVGTLGNVFYIPAGYKIWVSDNALIMQRKDNNSVIKFYFYHLSVRNKELIELNVGSTQPLITQRDLKNIKVPYPPSEEQTRIATVLSWFDDLIENKKKQNEILEKITMAIFKSWFIDFEPFQDEEFVYNEELDIEIPKGWEVKPIGEVADFTNGLSYKGSEKLDKYEDGAYVFITLNNIEERGGFKTEFAWIKSDRLKERHFVKEGDLIFANTEQTKTGRLLASPAFVVFPPDYEMDIGVYSHHITKVSPKKEYYKSYLYLIFRSYQEYIAQTYYTGTGVWGFDLKNFEQNYLIPIPPQPVIQRFHSLVEPIFKKIINNQKQILTLKKIRDVLLPQLVFGRLRVVKI